MNTHNATRPLAGLPDPGDLLIVWDVDGRAWTRCPSSGWWVCETPMCRLPWESVERIAGPLSDLPPAVPCRRLIAPLVDQKLARAGR